MTLRRIHGAGRRKRHEVSGAGVAGSYHDYRSEDLKMTEEAALIEGVAAWRSSRRVAWLFAHKGKR
jgi:hypothetical protein